MNRDSQGKLTCASRSNHFFSGTERNDLIIYHSDSNQKLVLGVQTDPNTNPALFITSSNVQVQLPLITAQLLSPVTGSVTLAPSVTSGIIGVVTEPEHAYQIVIISPNTTATSAIISCPVVTYQTTLNPITINVDTEGHVTITNDQVEEKTFKWTLMRII